MMAAITIHWPSLKLKSPKIGLFISFDSKGAIANVDLGTLCRAHSSWQA